MSIEQLKKRARQCVIDMKGYQSARSLYKSEPGMAFLDANECPFTPYPDASDLNRYQNKQPQPLVSAHCKLYDTTPDRLLIMRGADEAIDLLIRTFCEPSQDNIIICPPTFPMYNHYAELQGVERRDVSLLPKTFDVDVSGIIEAADENTKIIYLCSPNNPTGTVIPFETVERVCQAFASKAIVIFDEAYIEYADIPSLIPRIDALPNLMILRTLSKAYAAAGLRCGCVVGHPEMIALAEKVLAPYPIPVPVVEEAMKIMEPENLKRTDEKRADLIERRDRYIEQLRALPQVKNVYETHTNFILLEVDNSNKLQALCEDHKIIIRNQHTQTHLENHVRVTIGTEEQMQDFVALVAGKTLVHRYVA